MCECGDKRLVSKDEPRQPVEVMCESAVVHDLFFLFYIVEKCGFYFRKHSFL